MLLLRRTLLRKTFEVVPCEKLLYGKSYTPITPSRAVERRFPPPSTVPTAAARGAE
jgi:hypothetical protein